MMYVYRCIHATVPIHICGCFVHRRVGGTTTSKYIHNNSYLINEFMNSVVT